MLPVLKTLIPIVSKFFDDDRNIQKNWSLIKYYRGHSKSPPIMLLASMLVICLRLRPIARASLRLHSNHQVPILNF